jgi:hypothetical protein
MMLADETVKRRLMDGIGIRGVTRVYALGEGTTSFSQEGILYPDLEVKP